MEYIYLLIACAFFSLQFVFQKLFKERTVGGMSVCFWNQMICCAVSVIFLAVKSGPPSGFDLTAFLFVLAYAASGMLCSVSTITAMDCGRVSAVSTFCLAGGMVVPFFYGIMALDEDTGLTKWLGLIVLCLSLLPSFLQKTEGQAANANKLKFTFHCTIVFLTNGLVSVFSKMYMNYVDHTVTDEAVLAAAEDSFILTASVVRMTAALAILVLIALVRRTNGKKETFQEAFWEIGVKKMTGNLFVLLVVFAGGYAVCNTLGNLFSLRCMDTMDASIQFPLLSAVVIVLTAVFGLIFFREKIGKDTAISLLLSVAGIGLFMIQ